MSKKGDLWHSSFATMPMSVLAGPAALSSGIYQRLDS